MRISKSKIIIGLGCWVLPTLSIAMGSDDPITTMLNIDQLEVRDADRENPWAWDASFNVGKDFHKFWLKTEGEKVDGDTESMEVRALFSKAVSPYWDAIAGIRHHATSGIDDTWLELGAQGIAPYFFETELSLFVNKSGKSTFRIEVEKELMITQRWVLVPEIEASLNDYNDRETGAGSGLSEVEVGLRLLYSVKREFAPYLGIYWQKLYGNSADYAEEESQKVSESHIVFGIKAWF